MKATDLIIEVMREVEGLAKRDKNTQQGFNFRGIDAVMNAVGPALRKHGGFIMPQVIEDSYEQIPSKNGGTLNVARLTVGYQVYGSEGEPLTGVVAAEAFDSGDKATAKAMSVAYRTFLLQLLCLPTDEVDPDAQSYEIAAKPARSESKDWIAEGNRIMDKDQLRALYSQAKASNAPKSVLDALRDRAETL